MFDNVKKISLRIKNNIQLLDSKRDYSFRSYIISVCMSEKKYIEIALLSLKISNTVKTMSAMSAY